MDKNENTISISIRESQIESVTEIKAVVPNETLDRISIDKVVSAIIDRVVDKYIEDNYDNIANDIDMFDIASSVGKLIKNKLSNDILRKELGYQQDSNKKNLNE